MYMMYMYMINKRFRTLQNFSFKKNSIAKIVAHIKKITHVNEPFEALNERSHFKIYLYECLNHGPTENWTATGNPY